MKRILVFTLILIALMGFSQSEKALKFYKKGGFAQDKSNYSKAIKINPEDDYSFIGRAYSKGQIGDNNGAINDFSNAIEINSDDGFAFFGRAIYNNLEGNYNQACQDWIKASDLGYKKANKKANECSNAVPRSHGNSDEFSTGSQNHHPPQPSS